MQACYSLARYYSQDPDVFLRKSVSAVLMHKARTDRLVEAIDKMRPPDEGPPE